MKVLAIISSLRKMNTYNTVKQIENIHNKLYSCEYEYLFLKDAELKTCIGCHLCLTKGEHLCPLKDDRDKIIEKIESSDAVILASPNHTMNVNWLMKNFIDRLSYLMHRPRFFNQKFMILITSGSYMGVKQAIKALSPIVSGGKIISRLGVMNSPGMNKSKKIKAMKKVNAAAKRFGVELQKSYKFKANLVNILWFAAFKTTSDLNSEEFPADFEYYQNKRFFIETKLNFIQKAFSNFFSRLFQLLAKMGAL